VSDGRPAWFDDLWSTDRARQNAAFHRAIDLTDSPVDWAYDVWAELVGNLSSRDNHDRAIAAQVLANLAKSDPDELLLRDLDALVAVTRDARAVTGRHALQSLWKVGVAGERQRAALLSALRQRFEECVAERNTTLIRFDIAVSLRNVYDATGDPAVRETALALIATEPDDKYRRKYAAVWRSAGNS
jgi:hypothetical protein